ncbi:uncharacterized protein LODBEIA_P26020 [Lodderomyces beijingensis]|uniref:Uncharacterized protein n=1 Tax=Lodderomyces beijingensis TaxID=1775926 RepID=A0ABP0ZJQ1_9ASCO
MALEVLILPYSWFKSRTAFLELQCLINKAYDKPQHQFKLIETPRIYTETSLLKDLYISPNDECCFYLLLGGCNEIHQFEEQNGVRNFKERQVEACFDCDITEEFISKFDLSRLDDAKITIADDSFEMDDRVVRRCLVALALKTYHGQLFQSSETRAKVYELTAFCSFMRNAAARFLNYVIDHLLLSPDLFQILSTSTKLKELDAIIIHADYIVEHNLEQYYLAKCGFQKSPQEEDTHIKVNSDGAATYLVAEKTVVANRDFHISYIYRVIEVA